MLRHFSKKMSEIWVCETNSKECLKKGLGFLFIFLIIFCIFLRFYIYISGDGDKVEPHLLVLMGFRDKVYRPKLVKFYSVLHEKQRETFCYVLRGSELLWEYLLSREFKIIWLKLSPNQLILYYFFHPQLEAAVVSALGNKLIRR